MISDSIAIYRVDLSEVSVEDLQSILVFDLLFANADRHRDNLLVKKEGDSYKAYGIDHDACMAFDNRELKIEYLANDHAFNIPFKEVVKVLVSNENLRRYEEVIRNSDLSADGIDWMWYASEQIIEALENGKTAKATAQELIDKFKERYVE